MEFLKIPGGFTSKSFDTKDKILHSLLMTLAKQKNTNPVRLNWLQIQSAARRAITGGNPRVSISEQTVQKWNAAMGFLNSIRAEINSKILSLRESAE